MRRGCAERERQTEKTSEAMHALNFQSNKYANAIQV